MSQIVPDMACVFLHEPTKYPNCSRKCLHDLSWAHQWAKLFMVWLAWSNLSQPMSQTVLDMACVLLPEPTNEPKCSGYGWRDLTWANQWAKTVLDMACVLLPEPTNEPKCSGYGLYDLTWANQWAKWLGLLVDCDTWLPVPPEQLFSFSVHNIRYKNVL